MRRYRLALWIGAMRCRFDSDPEAAWPLLDRLVNTILKGTGY